MRSPRNPLAATALLNVGTIWRIRQQYQGSEPLILNALAMRRALYEEDHPAVLEALDQWGSLLYAVGRYAEAQQVVSDALDRVTLTLGGDHPTGNRPARIARRGPRRIGPIRCVGCAIRHAARDQEPIVRDRPHEHRVYARDVRGRTARGWQA